MIVVEQSTNLGMQYGVGAQKQDHSWGGGGCGRGGAEYKLLWQVKLDSRVKTLTARSVAILLSQPRQWWPCYRIWDLPSYALRLDSEYFQNANACKSLIMTILNFFTVFLVPCPIADTPLSEQPESGLFMD